MPFQIGYKFTSIQLILLSVKGRQEGTDDENQITGQRRELGAWEEC